MSSLGLLCLCKQSNTSSSISTHQMKFTYALLYQSVCRYERYVDMKDCRHTAAPSMQIQGSLFDILQIFRTEMSKRSQQAWCIITNSPFVHQEFGKRIHMMYRKRQIRARSVHTKRSDSRRWLGEDSTPTKVDPLYRTTNIPLKIYSQASEGLSIVRGREHDIAAHQIVLSKVLPTISTRIISMLSSGRRIVLR